MNTIIQFAVFMLETLTSIGVNTGRMKLIILKKQSFVEKTLTLPLLLQQCCSKEFSVFMVSGCYHLLRTRASCRHVLVYHMCDLGLQSM